MLTKITLNPLLDCMINEKCCSVDGGQGICPLSSSLWQRMAAQVSQPPRFFHPQQRNAYAMPGGSPGGGGGMLGSVGSPKIDWCIIVALLLIQALVEDQVHHPSDFGAQAIAITNNEDQEPIHSPNQITAVLNLVPVCSTPEGRKQNPCLLLIFFWGVFTWAKIIGFFCYLKPVPYVTCFSCWLLLNCFHNLNASFWTVNHSLALRLIQIALSLEYIESIFTLEWE